MKEVQDDQRHELKIIQDREVKEMKAQQTKASIESSRSVLNDRSLHNKAERDRRIRELNDYNTKRFIDQRKIQAQRHDRQTQELSKRHVLEEQELLSGMNDVRFSACVCVFTPLSGCDTFKDCPRSYTVHGCCLYCLGIWYDWIVANVCVCGDIDVMLFIQSRQFSFQERDDIIRIYEDDLLAAKNSTLV